MDVNHSLLVAMMFVMLLSIGIGNILIGLASLVQHREVLGLHWVPTSWLLLLLLECFDLFWHTLDILAVEQWAFAGFVYVTTGPILLVLATSLVLPDPARSESGNCLTQYFNVTRPFFFILVLYMLWLIGADLMLGHGLTATAAWSAVQLAVFIVLAVSKQPRLHALATAAVWLLLLSLLGARGLGLIG